MSYNKKILTLAKLKNVIKGDNCVVFEFDTNCINYHNGSDTNNPNEVRLIYNFDNFKSEERFEKIIQRYIHVRNDEYQVHEIIGKMFVMICYQYHYIPTDTLYWNIESLISIDELSNVVRDIESLGGTL